MVVLWKCELHQWFILHQVIVIGEGSKADAFVVSELMYNSWFPVSLSGSFNFVFIYHEGRVQQCISGCRVFTQHNYFARWTRKPANTIITKLHFGPFVSFNLSFFSPCLHNISFLMRLLLESRCYQRTIFHRVKCFISLLRKQLST